MRRYPSGFLSALAVAALVAAPPVFAQESQAPLAGWTISPSLLYSANWDDNVLLKQRIDQPPGDFMNALNPRIDGMFKGRRTQFSGKYDGAFLLYQDLTTLNSYDQRGSFSASRMLSRHVTLFVTDSLAVAPTTELAQLVGVPFLRVGAHHNDFRTGIDATLTKRTSITANYQFNWVRFDQGTSFDAALLGGHSHGGLLGVRHKFSERTTLTIDSDWQLSTVTDLEPVNIQNASAGFDRRLSESLRIYAAAGISRLSQALGPARFGPRYHAGVSHRLRSGSVDVAYDRSFSPSFGISGATASKDLSVRLHLPLWRRVYTQSAFAWRTNTFLDLANSNLESRSFEASIGYLAQPWMRIEGFFSAAHQHQHQTTLLPGGVIDRNRFGIQVITVKPVRIR